MAVENGIFVSAPGKIILFGEHAVVYGRTAVAGSIDLRTYTSCYTSQDGRIYLSLPEIQVENTWLLKDLLKAAEKLDAAIPSDTAPPPLDIVVPMARKLSGTTDEQCGVQHLAVLAFWYLLLGVAQRNKSLLAVKVTVRFELPSCVGLGSSGAYCVSTAAALLLAGGIIPQPTEKVGAGDGGLLSWSEKHLEVIRRWATQAESLIHGRASGLDAAVCTYGGLASFRPGSKIEHIKNSPYLKVVLVNSKVERNTMRMVTAVKERLRKFPAAVEGIFNSVDAISKQAIKILNQEDPPSFTTDMSTSSRSSSSTEETDHHSLQDQVGYFSGLNELCRMNNALLVALGVGHPKVETICTNLARYGIHPKMTGAGGGGSVFAFLKPDTSQTVIDMITQEITQLGFELWQPNLGGPGVCVHERRPPLLAPKQ